MVSIVRKHVVSAHGSAKAYNGAYIGMFINIICVILLILCVTNVAE